MYANNDKEVMPSYFDLLILKLNTTDMTSTLFTLSVVWGMYYYILKKYNYKILAKIFMFNVAVFITALEVIYWIWVLYADLEENYLDELRNMLFLFNYGLPLYGQRQIIYEKKISTLKKLKNANSNYMTWLWVNSQNVISLAYYSNMLVTYSQMIEINKFTNILNLLNKHNGILFKTDNYVESSYHLVKYLNSQTDYMGQLKTKLISSQYWTDYYEYSFNAKIITIYLLLRGNYLLNSKYKSDTNKLYLNLFQNLQKSITYQNMQIKQLNYYPEVYLCDDIHMDLLNNNTIKFDKIRENIETDHVQFSLNNMIQRVNLYLNLNNYINKYISFDNIKSNQVSILTTQGHVATEYSNYMQYIDRLALQEEETKLNIQNRDIKQLVDHYYSTNLVNSLIEDTTYNIDDKMKELSSNYVNELYKDMKQLQVSFDINLFITFIEEYMKQTSMSQNVNRDLLNLILDNIKMNDDLENEMQIMFKREKLDNENSIDYIVFKSLFKAINVKYIHYESNTDEYSSKLIMKVTDSIRNRFNDSTITHGNMFLNANNQLMNNRVYQYILDANNYMMLLDEEMENKFSEIDVDAVYDKFMTYLQKLTLQYINNMSIDANIYNYDSMIMSEGYSRICIVNVKRALKEWASKTNILMKQNASIADINYEVNNTGNLILSNVLIFYKTYLVYRSSMYTENDYSYRKSDQIINRFKNMNKDKSERHFMDVRVKKCDKQCESALKERLDEKKKIIMKEFNKEQ